MKTRIAILSLALFSLVLSAVLTAASASRMDGRCCMSSDGGRSYRFRVAVRRAAVPPTCSAYAAACMRDLRVQQDGGRMCLAAKAQCMQSGVHVGPYSGWQYAGMQRNNECGGHAPVWPGSTW